MNTNDFTADLMESLLMELDRQQEKWGVDRNLHPELWLTVLMEEVGEVSKALLEGDANGYPTEMLHVATVAFAAILDWYWANGAGVVGSAQFEPDRWVVRD